MRKIAIAVAVLVLLAAAAVFLLRSSEEEKIEAMLRECADAAERGDAEGILRHLTPACTLNGTDYATLSARIRKEVGRRDRIGKVELGVSATTGEGQADVKLHVRVRAAQHVLGETDLDLRLKKEGGAWKIAKIDEVR